MTITVATIHDVPANALRAVLQGPNGPVLVYMPGDTLPPVPVPSLTDIKITRITAINEECRSRLITRFGPAEEQVSRSIGVYGTTEKNAHLTGVAATVDASNVAQNAILAATTAAQVEAVTVVWPVI